MSASATRLVRLLLVAVLALMPAASADADSAAACPGGRSEAAAAAESPGSVRVAGYQVDQSVVDEVGKAIDPLIRLLELEFGPLLQLRVCIVGDPQPVPIGTTHVVAGVDAAGWTVTLGVHPVANVPADDLGGWLGSELSTAARTGVMSVVLWQASNGGLTATSSPSDHGVGLGELALWLSGLALVLSMLALGTVLRSRRPHAAPDLVTGSPSLGIASTVDTVPTIPTISQLPVARERNGRSPFVPPQLGKASIAASKPNAPPMWRDDGGHGLVIDDARLSGTAVVGASLIGHHARHNDRPCQDAFRIVQAGGRFVVAAVCDGVGSLPLSHLAARAAASAATRTVAVQLEADAHLQTIDSQRVVREVNGVLQRLDVGGAPAPAGSLATTLLVLAVDTSAPSGGPAVYATRVGDCALWALGSQGWTDLFAPSARIRPDARIDCGTEALPNETAQPSEILIAWPADTHLVLAMTDGVWGPMREGEVVRSSFARRLARPVAPLEFASLVGFVRQGANDDRTAVAVWKPT